MGIILDCMSVPYVITRVLIRGGWVSEAEQGGMVMEPGAGVCTLRVEEGPLAKEYRWLLEAAKGKENSPEDSRRNTAPPTGGQ